MSIRAVAELVALIAPPVCAACRAPLGEADRLICAACMRALPWLRARLSTLRAAAPSPERLPGGRRGVRRGVGAARLRGRGA